jgi:hypothetical protein
MSIRQREQKQLRTSAMLHNNDLVNFTVPVAKNAARAFNFILALSHALQVRDVRAVLILLVLVGKERSIATQPGMSVQFLADRIRETEESCRHLVRTLQAAGLVMRCGRAQRTNLFRPTAEAEQKLERWMSDL